MADLIFIGRVHKYGDHVDTDVIIPARHLNVHEPDELAKHALEDLDKDFIKKVKFGDIIVAGDNFGCGSSREHAPLAIKASGISCVIAKSFARIFYRNAFNIGLPLIESAEVVNNTETGQELEVNLPEGFIKNLTTGQTFNIQPLPEFVQQLLAKGGLVKYARATIKKE